MKSVECRQFAETAKKSKNQKKKEPEELINETVLETLPQEEPEICPYMEDVEKLSRSIPLTKLTLFHDAFVCMFNQEIGDEIYYYMKQHAKELSALSENYLPKRKARLKNYFSMALAHAGGDASETDAVMEIYNHMDDPKKNLQKLNVEAVKKFGQEQGTGYYKVLKKHIKIMSKL
jgi:hypothetical protein